MNIIPLSYLERLSGTYTKKVGFTTGTCKANNQYTRKIGIGLDNHQITYDLKYIGLRDNELAAVELFFSTQLLGELVSFKTPLDLVDGYFQKPSAWKKETYYILQNGVTKIRVTDLSFSLTLVSGLTPLNPLTITYNITPAASSVAENNTLLVYVTTTNIPDHTTLFYTIKHLTTNANDFSNPYGDCSIVSNAGNFSLGFTIGAVESSETFKIQLRRGSIDGAVVATSSTITLNDYVPPYYYIQYKLVTYSARHDKIYAIKLETGQNPYAKIHVFEANLTWVEEIVVDFVDYTYVVEGSFIALSTGELAFTFTYSNLVTLVLWHPITKVKRVVTLNHPAFYGLTTSNTHVYVSTYASGVHYLCKVNLTTLLVTVSADTSRNIGWISINPVSGNLISYGINAGSSDFIYTIDATTLTTLDSLPLTGYQLYAACPPTVTSNEKIFLLRNAVGSPDNSFGYYLSGVFTEVLANAPAYPWSAQIGDYVYFSTSVGISRVNVLTDVVSVVSTDGYRFIRASTATKTVTTNLFYSSLSLLP